MSSVTRRFVRPGLVASEMKKLEQTRDYLRWQLATLEQAIDWAREGYIAPNASSFIPTLASSHAHIPGEPSTSQPSIANEVRAVLADHRAHSQLEVITAVKAVLGERVRVPAIIAALRGKGIERQGDSYIIPSPAKEAKRRQA
jgi:hypothetical protein